MFITSSIDGYDVGGTAPLCLHWEWRESSNGSIPNIDLQPRCPDPWNTLSSQVQTVESNEEDALLLKKDTEYPVFSSMESPLQDYLLWARFIFCPASWRLDACHPLVDYVAPPVELDHDDEEEEIMTQEAVARVVNTTNALEREQRLVTTNFVAFNVSQLPQNVALRIDADVPAGYYRAILHLVALGDVNNTVRQWDVGAALEDPMIRILDPPTIRTVSDEAIFAVFAISVLGAAYAAFCLIFVARYRNNMVMKISQAPFLLLMTAAILVVFSMLFTFLPNHDWHCRAVPLSVLLPTYSVMAILNARVWRIYQTLSIASMLGQKEEEEEKEEEMRRGKKIRRCCRYFWCCCCILIKRMHFGRRIVALYTWLASILFRIRGNRRPAGPSFRRAVTSSEAASLLFMLVLPIIVVATFSVGFVDPKLILQINETEGRYVCDWDSSAWTYTLINVYGNLLIVFCVILAWISRDLPSAFNEKNQIFQVTGISLVVNILLLTWTEDPDALSTHPNTLVAIDVVNVVVPSLLVLLLIVQPKINRVWSGKEVVISGLLGKQTGSETSDSYTNANTADFLRHSSPSGGRLSTLPRFEPPKIYLKSNDSLPRKLELSMYQMLNILKEMTRRSNDGRSLRRSDWDAFSTETSKLSEWTKRIVLDRGGVEPTSQPELVQSITSGNPIKRDIVETTDISQHGNNDDSASIVEYPVRAVDESAAAEGDDAFYALETNRDEFAYESRKEETTGSESLHALETNRDDFADESSQEETTGSSKSLQFALATP